MMSGLVGLWTKLNRTYTKGKNDTKMKKDLSKSNGKKVYYARLLPVSESGVR
jgi:hypothetical protein